MTELKLYAIQRFQPLVRELFRKGLDADDCAEALNEACVDIELEDADALTDSALADAEESQDG